MSIIPIIQCLKKMKSLSLLQYSVTVPLVIRPVLHHRLDPKKCAKMCAKAAAIGPELASALDRTRVSNRNAAFIFHAAAKPMALAKIRQICRCLSAVSKEVNHIIVCRQ